MRTIKNTIRVALLAVAGLALAISLISLFYTITISSRLNLIVTNDIQLLELGEMTVMTILEARREEANFEVYLDTTYLDSNRRLVERARNLIAKNRGRYPGNQAVVDSVAAAIEGYDENMRQLAQWFHEEPMVLRSLQRPIMNYENELRKLTDLGRLPGDTLEYLMPLLNLSLSSASARLAGDRIRIITNLNRHGDAALRNARRIAAEGRALLAQHGQLGVRYGLKAQRNTLTILFIITLLLAYLIIDLPRRIFLPFRRMIKTLNGIAKGDEDYSFADVKTREFQDLISSFQKAIARLRYFGDLKSQRIMDVEREFYQVISEVREPICILNPDLTIEYFNEAFRSVLTIDNGSLDLDFNDITKHWKDLGDQLKKVELVGRFDFKVRIPGQRRKRKVTVIPMLDKDGKAEEIIIIVKPGRV